MVPGPPCTAGLLLVGREVAAVRFPAPMRSLDKQLNLYKTFRATETYARPSKPALPLMCTGVLVEVQALIGFAVHNAAGAGQLKLC